MPRLIVQISYEADDDSPLRPVARGVFSSRELGGLDIRIFEGDTLVYSAVTAAGELRGPWWTCLNSILASSVRRYIWRALRNLGGVVSQGEYYCPRGHPIARLPLQGEKADCAVCRHDRAEAARRAWLKRDRQVKDPVQLRRQAREEKERAAARELAEMTGIPVDDIDYQRNI